MPMFPKPMGHGTFNVEPFSAYRARLPISFNEVPDSVIESWIYRHWDDFQSWLILNPLKWKYSLTMLTSNEVLMISHVNDWPSTLTYWGDDLIDGSQPMTTWLGAYMLEHGTTPTPMIVAFCFDGIEHPREPGFAMKKPYQIIEGHMRLAYLQALIRRRHFAVKPRHEVYLVELPVTIRCSGRPL